MFSDLNPGETYWLRFGDRMKDCLKGLHRRSDGRSRVETCVPDTLSNVPRIGPGGGQPRS